MKSTPLVSVIMPTYNRADIIGPSIESVLNQTVRDLELIVVDDHSSDDTVSVIDRIKDPRVVYLKNGGQKGAPGARNFGTARARGRIVGFLDSDDQWQPHKLELQLPLFDQYPDVDVVGCGWQWLNKKTGHIRVVRSPHKNGVVEGLPRWAYNICPDLLIRRQLAQATPFDENLTTYECLEWVLRLSMGGHFAYVRDVLVDCYDHDGARNSDGQLRRLEGLRRIVCQHRRFVRENPQAWHALNLRLGAGFLVMGNNRRKALLYLSRSLRARPTELRTWVYAVASALPAGDFLVRAYKFRKKEGEENGG